MRMTAQKQTLSSPTNLGIVVRLLSLLWTLTVSISLCHGAYTSARARTNSNKNARSIAVVNESGVKIDVLWINPTTRELAESSVGGGIMYGGTTGINSYIGHSFEIQELPSAARGGCVLAMCRKAYFTVTSDEDQVFTVHKDFHVEIQNHRTKAASMAQQAIGNCDKDRGSDASLSPLERLDKYAACLAQSINVTLQAKQDDIDYERNIRTDLGQRMGSYACGDVNLTTSSPVRNATWVYKMQPIAPGRAPPSTKHDVRVLFESGANSVFVVERFFSTSDCRTLLESSIPAPAENSKQEENDPLVVVVERRVLPLTAKPRITALLSKLQQLILDHLHTAVKYDHDPVLALTIQTGNGKVAGEDCEAVTGGGTKNGQCAATAAASPVGPIVRHATDQALAHVRAFCDASNDLVGGAIHYPGAGVHLNPADGGSTNNAPTNPLIGSVVLTVYRDPDTLRREEGDPYVERVVECPVTHGRLVTVVEDLYVPDAAPLPQ